MELPRHIPNLSGNQTSFEASKRNFYISLGYLLLGLVYVIFLPSDFFRGYFFIFGIAGLTTYYLYNKNPKMGIVFEDDYIRYQPSFKRKYVFPVSDIEKIEIHLTYINILSKNAHSEKIELSNYPFSGVKILKDSFREYCELKNIICSFN